MPVTWERTVWTISNISKRLAMSMRTVLGCVLFISRRAGPLRKRGRATIQRHRNM